MKISKALATIAITVFLAGSVSACAPVVNLEPAEFANDPACAEIIVRLPEQIDGNEKRSTNAQATGAWGDPSAVLLRCGLAPVEASALPCVSAGEIDWLVDDSQKPSYRFITFGRTPATEVIVDSEVIAGVTALETLASAIDNVPANKTCTD